MNTSKEVICWGRNDFHQTEVPDGQYLTVQAGRNHNCAIRVDGHIVCWGNNAKGEATPPDIVLEVASGGGGNKTPTDCQVATYDNNLRQANLPQVVLPFYIDINGKPVQQIGLYTAVFTLPFGFSDLTLQSLDFIQILDEVLDCYAIFEPTTGLLTIPSIEIPSIIPFVPASQIMTDGPLLACEAQLQQSVLASDVFSLVAGSFLYQFSNSP